MLLDSYASAIRSFEGVGIKEREEGSYKKRPVRKKKKPKIIILLTCIGIGGIIVHDPFGVEGRLPTAERVRACLDTPKGAVPAPMNLPAIKVILKKKNMRKRYPKLNAVRTEREISLDPTYLGS